MKKLITASICFAGALTYVACVDYSEPATVSEAGAPASRPALITEEAGAPALPTPAPAPAADAGNTCGTRSFRGGAPSAVVCPGTTKCECGPADVCCMQKIDALSGACTSLSECRALALQCDGPEDCDGGVCCLEDRTGGGSSCKTAASCGVGQWLCRTDSDCINAPPGPRCAPIDLGTPGIDDVGLDGIVGVCGK